MIRSSLALLFIFVFHACVFATQLEYKHDDKIKNINIQKTNSVYKTRDNRVFDDHTKLLISFKNITPEYIDKFEKKYNLKLNRILIVGDYIYTHNDTNILSLIKKITYETNVKSVKPLWHRYMKTY